MHQVGLRHKLVVGFGGVLVILLALGVIGLRLLTGYSHTIERIFRENYDSVGYGQRMRAAVDDLDDAMRRRLWSEPGTAAAPDTIAAPIATFADNLRRELGNITLPGEAQAAETLRRDWEAYRARYLATLEAAPDDATRSRYRDELMPAAKRVSEDAQRIIDLNLENIVAVDGEVRASAGHARRTMYALIAAGVLLGVGFALLIARSILKPLTTLTASAREIGRGNLDLTVPVPGGDEIGELAEAFNAMAARLRESRRSDRLRLLRTQMSTQVALDSLPDAVVIVGADGAIEIANQAAQRLFGMRPGVRIESVRDGAFLALVARATAEVRSVQPRGYEAAIQVFDEHERFFLPHAVPIVDAERQVAGVTLVLADVTGLRRLDEMKSDLIAVVAHELRTPLTGLRMATHLLLDEQTGPLTPKQVELALAARTEGDRLAKVVDGLLDIGRIRSGRELFELKPMAPESLVATAVEGFAASYRDKGVQLQSAVPPELPRVLADPVRGERVLANLLGNALKFTDRGGRVRITAAPVAGAVEFTVQDTGAGIPAEHLPRVFERFYRVPSQPAELRGAGLGLAIARDIVEAHGGRIWAESTEGVGSRFHFTLPQADEPRAA